MTDKPAAGEPEGDAPATTPDDLEKRVKQLEKLLAELDPRLTGRINALNTTVATNQSAVTKRLGAAEADLGSVRIATENNAASITSFQGSLDTLTHTVAAAEAATAVQKQQLDTLESWQGAINTALVNGVQQAKDFALEQGTAARKHAEDLTAKVTTQLNQAKDQLDTRITAVENAPVKAHTHAVHLSGRTEDPITPAGKS